MFFFLFKYCLYLAYPVSDFKVSNNTSYFDKVLKDVRHKPARTDI